MLASEVINRTRLLAGDINAIQASDVNYFDWINDAIKEIVIQNQLCQKSASSNLVVNQDTYPLPDDIFKLYSVIINAEKIKVMTLQEWEELNAGWGGQNAMNPTGATYQIYAWAGNLVMYPLPDDTYSMKINYIYQPAKVTDGATNLDDIIPDTYHLRLVTYCLAQNALMDDDVAKYQQFMGQFQSGVIDLKYQHQGEEDLYPFISISARDAGEDFGLAYYG